MTKLEAVNEILEAIGEPPVEALDTGGTSAEAEAEAILDRESRRIQGEGWHVNTILERTYSPDGSNNIGLTDILQVRPVIAGHGRDARRTDTDKRYTIRDGSLYDLLEDSDEFDDDVRLEVVELLEFDTLPNKLASYITKTAAVKFQRYKKRGQIDDAFAREEMALARSEALREDSEYQDVNVLDTLEARRIRGYRNAIRGRQPH